MPEESSLRVSVATLNRVILVHPKDENKMLALERKATVSVMAVSGFERSLSAEESES